MKNIKINNLKKWHNLKDYIENKKNNIFFYEREIWFCHLGCNIGDEQDGKNTNFERPILIIKKFNKNIFLSVPLTSQNKIGKYYYQFEYQDKKYSIILSKIKILDRKRLTRKIRSFPKKDFEIVKYRIIKQFI